MNTKNRIVGLDVIRTVAVSLVIFDHASFMFNPLQSLPLIGGFFVVFTTLNEILGFFGVELFFVLSGFLISNILFSILRKDRSFKESVTAFLYSRWLRTIPNYALFLIINYLLYFSLNIFVKFDFRFLLFLQNFLSPHPAFFKEAWSLSVEEWFYLLLVFLSSFLFLVLKFGKKKVFLISVSLFVVASLVFKSIFIYSTMPVHYNFDEYFRKIVVFRFDAVAIGVFGFWFSKYYEFWWRKLKTVLLFTAIILIPISFYLFFQLYKNKYNLYNINNVIYFFTAEFYTLIWSVLILAVFPYFNGLSKFKTEKMNHFFEFFSKISYSLYLCNFPVLSVFKRTLFIDSNSIPVSFLNIAMYSCILVFLSSLLYSFYEKRFLIFRERFLCSTNSLSESTNRKVKNITGR